jgi:hypothetical protein
MYPPLNNKNNNIDNNENEKNESLSFSRQGSNNLLEALDNHNFISFYLHFTSFSIYQHTCMPEMNKEKAELYKITWFYLFGDSLDNIQHQQLFYYLLKIDFLSSKTLLLIAFFQNRKETINMMMDNSIYIDFDTYDRFLKWIGHNLIKKEIVFAHEDMNLAREQFFHFQLKHQLKGIY